MVYKNTLVRIKNENASHWNEENHMEKYKGFFAMIKRSYSGMGDTKWYSLYAIPTTLREDREDGYSLDYWKWKVTDFAEVEHHCSRCGKTINEEIVGPVGLSNSVFCKDCSESGYRERISEIDFYKNMIDSSSLMTEDEKNNTLKNFENLEVCAHCGKPMLEEPSGRDALDRPICYDCRNEYYYCENCNVLILRGEHFTGANGGIYCSDECVQEADPFDYTRELAYNAKPPLKFLGSSNENSLFMGVEVEVDGGEEKSDCIFNLSNITSDIYCKHDGSLNYGFEFVTHPATLTYHKNTLSYDKLIEECTKFGFKSHDVETTGLHVHVSRKFFGTPEKAKECAFKLEILMERFWTNILTFARRSEIKAERWAKRRYFTESENYDNLNDSAILQSFLNEMDYDRYTAINTTNANTIEFRIFKGTLKKDTIFATLEFIDLMCRYVKGATFENVKNITWEELFEPIDKNKYKELKNYMTIMGLLTSPMVA